MPIWAPKETVDKVLPGIAKKEVIIPAWNDIIHLARPPEYTENEMYYMEKVSDLIKNTEWSISRIAESLKISTTEVLNYKSMNSEMWEYRWRKINNALNIQKSPSPDIARNLGTIMTALDDVQDFTTTVGVLGRVLGRVFKPAELLAIGAFTVGEFLNRLTMMNKITGSDKAIICSLVKSMKKSSRGTTIKADVDKRMKRIFPSKGELLEIAQTTDQLFGVGISLGPLVGLVEDAYFGAGTGRPVRFKEWTISDREMQVIKNIGDRLIHPEKGLEYAFKDIAKWGESAANVIIGGESLGWNDFATGLVTSIVSNLEVRGSQVKEAAIGIWDLITGQKATPPKKTKIETKLLLQKYGIDPYSQDAWPVPGLSETANIQEIMEAYSKQGIKVLDYWRNKLGVSDEGLFLDACVKEISLHAAAMFCSEDGVIHESLDPSLLIYIHALEVNLNPPPETSTEKFSEWHDWILGQLKYYDISATTLEMLQSAYKKYFPG